MKSVTASEAKAGLGKLLEIVARGEEIIITRHEKPGARLVPAGRRNLMSVRDGGFRLLELSRQLARQEIGRAKISKAKVKAWIVEGRG